MPPSARISDFHVCPMITGLVPHVGGPIILGSNTVTIMGLPAAFVGSQATCSGPPDVISGGSATVMIEGRPAARMGDPCAHGGVIVTGAANVIIGG